MNARPDLIELVNLLGPRDPLHRMKTRSLERYLDDFAVVSARSVRTPAAVLLRASLRADPPSDLLHHLRQRHAEAVVMMYLPDFSQVHERALAVFDRCVDVFMAPTPEMRDFVAAFTPASVEVLIDPIDFSLDACQPNPVRKSPGPLRLMWFGYPESFDKSMRRYLPVLRTLVDAGEIEFHVITRNRTYGAQSFLTVHEYDATTFPALARSFDACLLSHQPFDFSAATSMKSENKAVLAIALGLPVAASRTPAYARLMRECALDDFLFASCDELVAVVRRLIDSGCRRDFLRACQPQVLRRYSGRQMALDWREMFLRARRSKFPGLTAGRPG